MSIGNQIWNASAQNPIHLFHARYDPNDTNGFWLENRFKVNYNKINFFHRISLSLFDKFNKKRIMQIDKDRGLNDVYSRHLSASKIMSTVTDQLLLNTESGGEVIEVAYQHVFFISAEGGLCDTKADLNLKRNVALSLMQSLRGYYDETHGIRVEFLVSPTMEEGSVTMGLGPGVFVPRANEKPIGWIRFYPDPEDRQTFLEPKLLNGSPAGIYKGQTGLAFSVSKEIFPARLDLKMDIAKSMYFFLSRESAKETLFDRIQPNIQLKRDERGSGLFPTEASSVEPGVDKAWSILFTGSMNRKAGLLEVCVDARPSRLRHAIPSIPHYKVDKISIDISKFKRKVDRIWFDFDHLGRLASNSLQTVANSAIWDADTKRIYAYNWSGSMNPFKNTKNIDILVTVDGSVVEFSRYSNSGFGYLHLPEETLDVVFSDEIFSSQVYSLDWLDECGRISIDGKAIPLGQAYSELETKSTIPGSSDPGAATENKIFQLGPLVLRASGVRRP